MDTVLITNLYPCLKSKPYFPFNGRGFSISNRSRRRSLSLNPSTSRSGSSCASASAAKNGAVSVPPSNGVYTVGDFMTKREDLHTVKPTTTVDEALQMLVEYRITGFPVIDDDWKLVGVVSDYDLLALDSISGQQDEGADWSVLLGCAAFRICCCFYHLPTFNEIQKLLSKTNGKVIGELMTPAPLVVRETTNLEDAARLLLETKYRHLPVVDNDGKLVGIITRGNVVRAALEIKRATEKSTQA